MKECNDIEIQLKDNFSDYGSFFENNYQFIVVLLRYNFKNIKVTKGMGNLSRYSWGKDYHIILKEKLYNIFGETVDYIIDSSTYNERYLALKSGLGYIGKNNLLINKKHGTFTFIGAVKLKDKVSLKNDYNIYNDLCEDCNICEKNCPVEALNNYKLDTKKCISSISQTKKKLNIHEIKSFKNMIWGCDICQLVCPYNKYLSDLNNTDINELKEIDIIELFNMSNKDFKTKFNNKAFTWKGKLVILRNAICVAFNKNYFDVIPYIEKSLKEIDVVWYLETAKLILDKFKEKTIIYKKINNNSL